MSKSNYKLSAAGILIQNAIYAAGLNMGDAAVYLEISRPTLYARLSKTMISRDFTAELITKLSPYNVKIPDPYSRQPTNDRINNILNDVEGSYDTEKELKDKLIASLKRTVETQQHTIDNLEKRLLVYEGKTGGRRRSA